MIHGFLFLCSELSSATCTWCNLEASCCIADFSRQSCILQLLVLWISGDWWISAPRTHTNSIFCLCFSLSLTSIPLLQQQQQQITKLNWYYVTCVAAANHGFWNPLFLLHQYLLACVSCIWVFFASGVLSACLFHVDVVYCAYVSFLWSHFVLVSHGGFFCFFLGWVDIIRILCMITEDGIILRTVWLRVLLISYSAMGALYTGYVWMVFKLTNTPQCSICYKDLSFFFYIPPWKNITQVAEISLYRFRPLLLLQQFSKVFWRILSCRNDEICLFSNSNYHIWWGTDLSDLLRWVGQNCHLLEVADSFGSLAAQKRNESRMHTGFSFLDCKVDGTGIQIFLGRAWGNFSRTVYAYTYMNDIIYSGGWSDFGFPQRDQ